MVFNHRNKPFFREVHLELDHWNNIPASNSINYSYNNCEEIRDKRAIVHQQIIPILRKIIIQCLTTKQLQVIKLCKIEYHFTQSETATILKITQPTVHQHLYGKKRKGKQIGGAYKRIRKTIKKASTQKYLSTPENRILTIVEEFFDSSLSRRKREKSIKQILPGKNKK